MAPNLEFFKEFIVSFYDGCLQNWEWIVFGMILGLIEAYIHNMREKLRPIKTTSNENGELFVTQDAILTILSNSVKNSGVPTVSKIKIKDKKNSFLVKIYIKLYEDQTFDKMSTAIQDQIQQILIRYFGVTKHIKVNIIMDGSLPQPIEHSDN